MPELPEVETVVRSIRPKLENKSIQDCQIYNNYSRIILHSSFLTFQNKILGKKIIQVTRRAKYIVIHLSEGYLIFHLRMTGQFYFDSIAPKHATFSLSLSQGKMHFVDTRKFGTVEYHPTLDVLEKKLGPEPLSKDFKLAPFQIALSKSAKNIKAYLLDQSKVAGLGNIYVDEVLWQAKIHPATKANEISKLQTLELFKAIPQILKYSIKHQGTTFINFYFEESKSGNFQNMLKVFNKAGEPCPRCSKEIIKIKFAGRGTHLCPKCQKNKGNR